jgi:hypothetical protein
MTILDQITREAETLSAKERREALQLIRSLKRRTMKKRSKPTAAPKDAINKRELHAALRGFAGMWKDRTDLPKDPVAAVKVLRSRMKSRGRND